MSIIELEKSKVILQDYAVQAPAPGPTWEEELVQKADWVLALSACPYDGEHEVSLADAKRAASIVKQIYGS